MQTPKGRSSSSKAQQKARPGAVRQLKTTGLDSDSASSSILITTPKDKSPKVVDFRSPRSPVTKKKRPSRISELESQVSQLQEELKTAKDQLSSSESLKKEAMEDAEESKNQLLAIISKLEESQKQLVELSAYKEAHVTQLQKFSQEHDRAWQLELETAKQQQLFDSVALASALAEIQQLKVQLEMAAESGAADKKLAESADMEAIRSDGSEACKSITSANDHDTKENIVGNQRSVEAEVNSLMSEVGWLRTALETAETKLHEEQIRSTVQIRSAHEMAEEVKAGSLLREAELKAELKQAKADIEELKAELMDKENEWQGISEENEVLNVKLKNSLSYQGESEQENYIKRFPENVADMKMSLMDKETQKLNILKENEIKRNNEVGLELEAAMAARQEADKKAARVAEQLEAAQAANSEMEAELRRLKVQCDQWRKAAETAAAMLSSAGNNGKLMERTTSLDGSYNPVTGNISSTYNGEMDDDLLKKKNGNMLKKIGVLWKKPQK